MSIPVIKSFKIINLFGQSDVSISFEDKVSIFIGENGLGKTTILQCLYYTLKVDFEKLLKINFERIEISFQNEALPFFLNKKDIIECYKDRTRTSGRYRVQLKEEIEKNFLPSELEKLNQIMMSNRGINIEDPELKLFVTKLKDKTGLRSAQIMIELDRYFTYEYQNYPRKNVAEFKKKISEKIKGEILYFPTYRRIEEEMTNLMMDGDRRGLLENRFILEKSCDLNSSRHRSHWKGKHLIQFGMTDVERTIKELLERIKTMAIDGFTEMTGILLKEYLQGDFGSDKRYHIDEQKLDIILERIGSKIAEFDKNEIRKRTQDKAIYERKNIYLLNLIKNLIKSYEKQNFYDEKIRRFVATCNSYLIDKKYIYNESDVELKICQIGSKKTIDLKNLSSGEKQIISIFSKLYLEDYEDCIIIFDEPELSLSIKWQERFLPDIINSETCSMLIAVTHSPFIFDNELSIFASDMSLCIKAQEPFHKEQNNDEY